MNLAGKNAIVTGAASGIGLAIARSLAVRGARVTLADIERAPLERATHALEKEGHSVLAVTCDVASWESVGELVSRSQERWGPLHVMCNNAGVNYLAGEPIWETPPEVWQWMMNVNFWGVVHGIRAAIPIMLAHGEPSHIVNTASTASLCTGGGIYGASKHAIASLSESLLFDLKARSAAIGVTLLLPGLIATNIVQSTRNLPDAPIRTEAQKAYEQRLSEIHATHGMAPERVGERTALAIERGEFYAITDPALSPLVQERVDNVAAGREPVSWQTPRK